MRRLLLPIALLLLPWTTGCRSSATTEPAPPGPIAGARPVDHLIEPGERHFARMWQVTRGGENAEAYWSLDGTRLSLQRRAPDDGIDCDRIFVTQLAADGDLTGLQQISDGRGVTTCAHFLPDGQRVVFASTGGHVEACPPPVDFSQGYVWAIRPEYDLFVHDLASGETVALVSDWGYDAEATVSPRGDRMVFTSTRSGDLELWTCALDGSDPVQVTDAVGYDGGAFFSHDGESLVFRTTAFTPGAEAEEQETYRELLKNWTVRPHSMELVLIDANGSNRRRLTALGGANFAPFFFPDDRRVIFSTNHHEGTRNFDLFAIDVDGTGLERITTYEGFDSFPMFSPDGRYVAFASNRGGTAAGETNVFVAEWRP